MRTIILLFVISFVLLSGCAQPPAAPAEAEPAQTTPISVVTGGDSLPEPVPEVNIEPRAELEIVEIGCRYQYASYFILYAKSITELPVPLGSSIIARTEGGQYASRLIQSEYANGTRLWQDKAMGGSMGSYGQKFYIEGINPRNGKEHIDQDYMFLYCPPKLSVSECDESSGTLIYRGNAIEDCTLEGDDINYFTPARNIIEIPA
ncbi:MAG: hypothetical protein ABH854_04825 [Candidatus Diapherotrites archaeon]|nr:hypothetical protein [Candidatus Micrarchaeota archaeon]MBU1939159.1 hypothetical protein [Candidatus Micrarchaeota archaeon]